MPKAEIIGLGRSGIAAAKLLSQDGWEVTIADAASEENLISRSNLGEFQALSLIHI